MTILFLALHTSDDNIQYIRDKGFSYLDIPAGAAQLPLHLKKLSIKLLIVGFSFTQNAIQYGLTSLANNSSF